jgi:hypothetical protein
MLNNQTPYLAISKTLLAAFFLTLVLAIPCFSQPVLRWKVISSGGTNATSGSLKLKGTIGQTATTLSTSGATKLNAGFWQNFGASGGCCIGVRGDFNGDGIENNILDLTFIIDDIFRGGPAAACPAESDLNGDGILANILDLTYIIDDIFRGGPPPGPCP